MAVCSYASEYIAATFPHLKMYPLSRKSQITQTVKLISDNDYFTSGNTYCKQFFVFLIVIYECSVKN